MRPLGPSRFDDRRVRLMYLRGMNEDQDQYQCLDRQCACLGRTGQVVGVVDGERSRFRAGVVEDLAVSALDEWLR